MQNIPCIHVPPFWGERSVTSNYSYSILNRLVILIYVSTVLSFLLFNFLTDQNYLPVILKINSNFLPTIMYPHLYWHGSYIFLMKYDEMQKKYVDMQTNRFNMQHNYVGMQGNCNKITIIFKKSKITSNIAKRWLPTCQMQIIYVCMWDTFVAMQLSYINFNLVMLTRNCFMSTSSIVILTCEIRISTSIFLTIKSCNPRKCKWQPENYKNKFNT